MAEMQPFSFNFAAFIKKYSLFKNIRDYLYVHISGLDCENSPNCECNFSAAVAVLLSVFTFLPVNKTMLYKG